MQLIPTHLIRESVPDQGLQHRLHSALAHLQSLNEWDQLQPRFNATYYSILHLLPGEPLLKIVAKAIRRAGVLDSHSPRVDPKENIKRSAAHGMRTNQPIEAAIISLVGSSTSSLLVSICLLLLALGPDNRKCVRRLNSARKYFQREESRQTKVLTTRQKSLADSLLNNRLSIAALRKTLQIGKRHQLHKNSADADLRVALNSLLELLETVEDLLRPFDEELAANDSTEAERAREGKPYFGQKLTVALEPENESHIDNKSSSDYAENNGTTTSWQWVEQTSCLEKTRINPNFVALIGDEIPKCLSNVRKAILMGRRLHPYDVACIAIVIAIAASENPHNETLIHRPLFGDDMLPKGRFLARSIRRPKNCFTPEIDRNPLYVETVTEFRIALPEMVSELLQAVRQGWSDHITLAALYEEAGQSPKRCIFSWLDHLRNTYCITPPTLRSFATELREFLCASEDASLATAYWLTGKDNHEPPTDAYYLAVSVEELSAIFERALRRYLAGEL